MLIAVDWSHTAEKLAVYDGKNATKVLPEGSPNLVVVTENMPAKYAKPLLEKGAIIKRCSPNATAEFRESLNWEKTDEKDAELIYRLYNEKPELFRKYILPAPEKACLAVFKSIQKNRMQMEQRLWHLGEDDKQLRAIVKNLEAAERAADRMMIESCEETPIYKWLTSIRGIGPRLASTIIALTSEPDRFSHIASFWKYSGLAVNPDGTTQKKKAGVVAAWNHELKAVFLKDVGDCLIRAVNPLYYNLYLTAKANYSQRIGTIDKNGNPWTKLRAHRAARRKMVKIFVEHYLAAYWESKGLPVTEPWAIQFGGHTDYIQPLRSIKEFLDNQGPGEPQKHDASQRSSETQCSIASQQHCENQNAGVSQ